MSKGKTTKREPDYVELAKQLTILVDSTNPDRFRVYRTTFFKGVLMGVGSVLGATVVIALLLWVLSLLGEVPFVGPITDSVRSTIEKRQ